MAAQNEIKGDIMIPKIIHYCWFGRGEKPKLAQKCIASWKKYCPDYEIMEWNEDNFDIAAYPYASYCLEHKKWAFLSDFVRLCVVAEHGGIYFDTDVELVKKPDELLQYEAFYGYETPEYVNTGEGFGAIAGHVTVMAMRQQYLSLSADESGAYEFSACPALNTRALIPLGFQPDGTRQTVAGAEILPAEYLNPYHSPTGRLNQTKNTVAIHWYAKSWMSKLVIAKSILARPFHRLIMK